jgi:hypothetical protein
MRIIQEIHPGFDCPKELAENPKFKEEIIRTTRRRLELRPWDIVEVKFV